MCRTKYHLSEGPKMLANSIRSGAQPENCSGAAEKWTTFPTRFLALQASTQQSNHIGIEGT